MILMLLMISHHINSKLKKNKYIDKDSGKFWTCKCKMENSFTSDVCLNCCRTLQSNSNRNLWVCMKNNCSFRNFDTRTACKKCNSKNPSLHHRIAVTNLSESVKEIDIKNFFLPILPMQIDIMSKDKSKSNVFFKTHNDAVKSMQKQGGILNNKKLNLFIDSNCKNEFFPDNKSTGDKRKIGDETTLEQNHTQVKFQKMEIDDPWKSDQISSVKWLE